MTGATRDPVRVGEGLTGHSVGAERRRQDALIAEIRAATHVSDAYVDRAIARLEELRESPVPWLATRYLQSVLTRGEAMFTERAATQLPLDAAPVLVCGCGEHAPIEDRERVDGRWLVYARCPACRADLAAPELSG